MNINMCIGTLCWIDATLQTKQKIYIYLCLNIIYLKTVWWVKSDFFIVLCFLYILYILIVLLF